MSESIDTDAAECVHCGGPNPGRRPGDVCRECQGTVYINLIIGQRNSERARADAADREREELREHWYQDRDRALAAEAKLAAVRREVEAIDPLQRRINDPHGLRMRLRAALGLTGEETEQ